MSKKINEITTTTDVNTGVKDTLPNVNKKGSSGCECPVCGFIVGNPKKSCSETKCPECHALMKKGG